MTPGPGRTEISVRIREATPYTNPVRYVLQTIAANQKVTFQYVVEAGSPVDLMFDHTDPASQPVAITFYKNVRSRHQDLHHEHVFMEEQVVKTNSGQTDLVATIFYMINCLQEQAAGEDDLDHYGRFKYTSSYQYRFGSAEHNLVQQYIDTLTIRWGLRRYQEKSSFFISHDIDALYGSFVHDGLWALKRGRIDILLKLVWNVLVQKPEWRNVDRILKLNDTYGIKSTFFWIVNRGRDALGIKNADYNIAEETDLLSAVVERGCANGLHKSTLSATLDEELSIEILNTTTNRYHYLKHLPARDWAKIAESAVTLDASLGFAEHIGFRNSYGRPFQPYDISKDEPFGFVVAPLHLMDGTFTDYLRLPRLGIGRRVIDFYRKHTENCVLSLLWHNTNFTPYLFAGMQDEYVSVVEFIEDERINCLLPDEMRQMGSIAW